MGSKNFRNNTRRKKIERMNRVEKIKIRNKPYSTIKNEKIEEYKNKLSKYSEMLVFLDKKGFQEDVYVENEKAEIQIPKVFSLIKNPDEVIKVLQKIIGAFRKGVKEIEFDYSQNTELEIGAISLKNVICLDIFRQGITLGGNFPGCKDLNEKRQIKDIYKQSLELLLFSGLFKKLKMDEKEYISFKNYYRPLTLPLIGGGRNTIFISCKSLPLGKIESEITKYFDKALHHMGKELSQDGKRLFDKMIGEVITNCQEHSGEFNQYFCSGHYSKIDSNVGNYQLTIFNFGQSIAEGLMDTSIPEEVKKRMDELIKKHLGYFKIFSNWDKDTLLTLFSLQNKISRVYDDKKTRGTGTVKLLEAFQNFGGCLTGYCSSMTIISGSSQILINNNDKICKIEEKQICFNKEKSLDYKPDERYVKKIDEYFPGTIISLNIFLDKNWLNDKLNKEKKGGKDRD